MSQFVIAVITSIVTVSITSIIYRIFGLDFSSVKGVGFIVDMLLWVVIFLPTFMFLDAKFGKKENTKGKNGK